MRSVPVDGTSVPRLRLAALAEFVDLLAQVPLGPCQAKRIPLEPLDGGAADGPQGGKFLLSKIEWRQFMTEPQFRFDVLAVAVVYA
jgi:hypothetical protein